jgi:nitrite reductase (cytochrome c-552)
MAETTDHEARVRRRRRLLLVIAAGAALVTVVGVALLMNIFERKQEARNPFYRVVELTDDTEDPAVWGKNFPLQYDDYRRTVDQVRTRFGGSEALPRTPTRADPRTVVAQSKIEEDPRLKTMWAGYAFAKDFREERGHAYMLDDQIFTERQQAAKQPGTCLQCHASLYVPYRKAGLSGRYGPAEEYVECLHRHGLVVRASRIQDRRASRRGSPHHAPRSSGEPGSP